MKRIIKAIELLQATKKSPEEISEIVGDITPYTIRRVRHLLGWKKYANKTVDMMTKGNLKEFYALLESELNSFQKLRRLFELLLTTNFSDEKISEVSVYKISHVQLFRQKFIKNQCDWQVMKGLNNPELLDYIHKDNPLHIPCSSYKEEGNITKFHLRGSHYSININDDHTSRKQL